MDGILLVRSSCLDLKGDLPIGKCLTDIVHDLLRSFIKVLNVCNDAGPDPDDAEDAGQSLKDLIIVVVCQAAHEDTTHLAVHLKLTLTFLKILSDRSEE